MCASETIGKFLDQPSQTPEKSRSRQMQSDGSAALAVTGKLGTAGLKRWDVEKS